MKIVAFDEAARRVSPGTSSMRGSRLEEGWHDRERQRHDQDPRLRPTRPEYSGSVVEETAATGSSGTNDAELLEAAPSRPSVDRCRSWRFAVKRGSTRSCPPPRFRPGGEPWKPASPAKVGGEGDSRIERSKGYSSCRSVADAGFWTHLPQRGEAGRKAESAGAGSARRGGSTLTTGARLVAGERVRGDRGQTSSERAAACSDREIGGFYQRKASWFRYSSSP